MTDEQATIVRKHAVWICRRCDTAKRQPVKERHCALKPSPHGAKVNQLSTYPRALSLSLSLFFSLSIFLFSLSLCVCACVCLSLFHTHSFSLPPFLLLSALLHPMVNLARVCAHAGRARVWRGCVLWCMCKRVAHRDCRVYRVCNLPVCALQNHWHSASTFETHS